MEKAMILRKIIIWSNMEPMMMNATNGKTIRKIEIIT
jgi:hypothetical protein